MTGMDWQDPAGLLSRLGQGKWPPLDLVETANELIVRAAIPGLERASDVRLELRGTLLTLDGEIVPETQGSAVIKVHQQERRQGKFNRTINLPVAVHSKSARATYQRGILEVRLAKILGSQVETLTIDFLK
ncbi:hypothetical protein SY88_07610 [Clostridiales bacterium PH28_bin88]|nr:hypothetical protein SY88_07610 [Clostridiales bacterium PH28_bin88]